jgi:hypothetical protein
MQSSDSSTCLALLPHEVLVHVLRWLEPRERLSTCALVCHSLHAAAGAATEHLELSCTTQKAARAAVAWLHRHASSALSKLSFEGSFRCRLCVALPWHSLHHLRDLKLHRLTLQIQRGSSSSCGEHSAASSCSVSQRNSSSREEISAVPLAALTALTRLELWGCDITCFGEGMVQLTALSRLRKLHLCDVYTQISTPECAAQYSAAFGITLGQLSQLTCLSLAPKPDYESAAGANWSGVVLASVGTLFKDDLLKHTGKPG